MKVGLNVSIEGPQNVSSDLMYQVELPYWPHFQTTLAVPYVAGSGLIKLTNPEVAMPEVHYAGTPVATRIRIFDRSGGTHIDGYIIVGTPYFHAADFAGDRDMPAGTLIDRPGQWSNSSADPADWALAPNFVDRGRDTGYPNRLKPG